MSWGFVAACTLVVALVLTACCRSPGPSAPALTIVHEITPEPPRVGPATLVVKLADPSGNPVAGAHVIVEGIMSHAGMVPVFSEAKEIESGKYELTLELTMSGDWVLLVHSVLADGRKLEGQFDVKGVRSR